MNTRYSPPCGCDAYHFTHRRGSGLCFHRVFDKEGFEERAAIGEFEGGLSREAAEQMAVIEQHEARYRMENELDLWAVWPDGTECSLMEKRDIEELLTWKSDDYEVKVAIAYDGAESPIFA